MIYDYNQYRSTNKSAMTNNNVEQPAHNVTCPACGLLCDDISPQSLSDNSLNCVKAKHFFERARGDSSPKIKGQPASLAQAVASVTALLKTANTRLYAGLSTDVNGFRAVQSLAQATHGKMTHMNATSSLRNYKVLQQFGWQTTTLTEVRNRADVILLVGTDAVTRNPRFFERVVWVDDAMFVKSSERQIVYLGGEGLNTQAGVSPDGKSPIVVPCALTALPEVMAMLRALVAGKPVKVTEVAGVKVETLQNIAEILKAAKYATLAWNNKDLDIPHAELTIQNITETVVTLNQKTRAMALPLGGSDGDTSVTYAHTWLNGVIPQQADLTEHDIVVWVNSFSPEYTVPESAAAPLIVLGAPDSQFAKTPDVFIPIATPGLETDGTLFRVDGSVVIPIYATRESSLPTLADVVKQIEQALLEAK